MLIGALAIKILLKIVWCVVEYVEGKNKESRDTRRIMEARCFSIFESAIKLR